MKNSLTQKLNKFKASPLIVVVAIIEVILLICVSTFAWFIFASNRTVDTSVITVEPDSGLEIDFKDADEKDSIKIWNYLNEFQFEPVTSLDGRNLFIPTTGTFSYYANDFDSPSAPDNPGDTQNTYLIYFDTKGTNWDNVPYIECDYSTFEKDGLPMKRLNSTSTIYYYDLKPLLDKYTDTQFRFLKFRNGINGSDSSNITNQFGTVNSCAYDTISANYLYKCELVNGNAVPGNQSGHFGLMVAKPEPYTGTVPDIGGSDSGNSGSGDGTGAVTNRGSMKFREATVNDMNSKYINIDFTLTNTNSSDTDPMDVFLSSKSFFNLYDPKTNESITSKAIRIAFYQNDGASGKVVSSRINSQNTSSSTTVYFNNSLGWEQPHAYVWKANDIDNKEDDVPNGTWPGTPMNHASGDIYYYTFDNMYDSIIFSDGNSKSGAVKTVDIYNLINGYIYNISNVTEDSKVYSFTCENYLDLVDDGTFPVVSPGTSTGFQRPYAPVIDIDKTTGAPKVIIPAFASSIDDYNNGSGNSLFTIAPGQTLSLSMIIWLEGTDPDCNEDVYAGKYIDMKLVFATKYSPGEETYEYNFLDHTNETWIDDEIITETGVSVNPVMQLYDAVTGKGYLMKLEEGSNTKWVCKAPQSLEDSQHLIFRRVNPLNEDEVWNYWDTDGFGAFKSDAITTVGDVSTVKFTAFADGAPTHAKDKQGNSSDSPDRSCGGLWGEHNYQKLCVYDATKSGFIDNDNGALTIKYTYNNQTIEYKASGPTNGFFTFVVPDAICKKPTTGDDNRPSVQFKRYYYVDGSHAINSLEYQKTIMYDNENSAKWVAGHFDGHYYSINQTSGGTYRNYWGDDIIYVQCSDKLKSQLNRSDCIWQARFYPNSESNTNQCTYAYLYKNSDGLTNDFQTYPCVVPSDKEYQSYRVEQVDSSDVSTRWNRTGFIPLTSSATDFVSFSNKVLGDETSNSICKMEYLQHTIFFQMPSAFCSDTTYVPYMHVFSGNNPYVEWPGIKMEKVDMENSACKKYKATVNVSDYNKVIFSTQNVVALAPGNTWNQDNAWFAAYFFNSSNNNSYWVKGEWLDGLVKAAVPIGYDKMIWVRINPDAKDCTFDTDWGKTADLDVPDFKNGTKNNQYNIEGWSDKIGTGKWVENGCRLQSIGGDNALAIGTDTDRNAMIIQGTISDGNIDLSKLEEGGAIMTEDGYDKHESVVCSFYKRGDTWP